MDNATFDRLARLLAGGASRRHTLRAIIAAALAGTTAEELLAAKKDRKKNGRDNKKDDDKDRKDRDRGRGGNQGSGDGNSDRVAAQGKKNNNKRKRKRKNKRKPNNGGGGGVSCAGTPLRPGQSLVGCDYSGENLRGRDLNSSSFTDVNLSDADLCGADLESTSFDQSDLTDANLTDVNLNSSSHNETSFAGANLTGARLRISTFNEVDFSGADLTGADFTGSTFSDVGFAGAIFCRTTREDGRVDNSDCDICDNICGLCEECGEDCTPPDCCEDPETGDGVCVDTETDPLNCGGCEVACFDNLANTCVEGECVCGNDPSCTGGKTCCRGEGDNPTRCVNTNNDTLNCGGCGAACLIPTNPCLSVVCQAGKCVVEANPNGSACAEGEDEGLCCTSGGTSTCIVGAQCCSDSQCTATEACCENQCIDVQDDSDNCGACAAPCLTSKADACTNGACTCGNGAACLQSTTCCSGDCVAVSEDRANCGACGNVCETDETCDDGVCTRCPGRICGNTCINLLGCCDESMCPFVTCRVVESCTDNQCVYGNVEGGVECLGGSGVCADGQCVCGAGGPCQSGLTCCDGQCVDIGNNPNFCGSCDIDCGVSLNPCIDNQCIASICTPVEAVPSDPCLAGLEGGICCPDVSSVVCLVGAECCDDVQCAQNPDGATCCGNQCVDTLNNVSNCGSCGNACSSRANDCSGGACVCGPTPQCAESETCCSNTCIATSSDRFNCGSCRFECVGGICDNGSCVSCEGGIPCGSECLENGENVCCVSEDCERRKFCEVVVGCSEEHICLFANEDNGAFCGCGGECQDGVCVGQGEC